MAGLGRIGHALWQGLATLSQCEAKTTEALARSQLAGIKLLLLGARAPWVQSWASIYGELFEQVLRLAVKGHLIIGMLRLYGFNAFRNTYKPLLAESIVEFWNRYF